MCGIVGYIGNKDALQTVTKGLQRLEYRGYDSAGVAFFPARARKPRLVKAVGKLHMLVRQLSGNNARPNTATIGHTRWATHGIPTKKNAHPHIDCKRDIVVVHNGIIENHQSLREVLEREGHTFRSDTDSEVIAHLIERMISFGSETLEEAVREALRHVQGTFGIVVTGSKWPEQIVGARKGSPLIVGVGDGEYIIASDASAIAEHTKHVIYLDDDELISITPESHRIFDISNNTVAKTISTIDWSIEESQKSGFEHFMLKEIFEAPQVIENALRGRIVAKENRVKLGGLESIEHKFNGMKRIVIAACGTSYYAGRIGKYYLEHLASVPVEVAHASEFRYAPKTIDSSTVVVAISQSGETADTLEAVREAKRYGALTVGIVNVVGSSIAREVDAGIYNHAGSEIAVASTKAFISQLLVLALFAHFFAEKTSHAVPQNAFLDDLQKLSATSKQLLERHASVKKIAKKYKAFDNMLYIGRRWNWPTALEGALKLKEVSYIHAEGYPAGELKHGPLALIDKKFPTIAIAFQDSLYEKMISNIQEIRARKGPLLALATDGDTVMQNYTNDVIFIPPIAEEVSPIVAVIPLQLFAYYVAVHRGTDVDKPRNLAKSVTVE